MLAKRIIPCLDVDKGRVVKGTNFIDIRDAGDAVELARFYDEAGADELVFLDITASHEKRDIVLDMVRKTADQVFIPFTVGGGLKTVEDMHAMLQAGGRQGEHLLAGHPDAGTDHPGRQALRQPVHRGGGRRQAGGPGKMGTLYPRRTHTDRPGCDRMGEESGKPGGGRNPADFHGRRRHQGGLRPGTDQDRVPGREDPGHRFGRRGQPGPPL